MKAFVITAILPNEWDKQSVLSAINAGIQRYSRENPMSDTATSIWAVTIAEEFKLQRQDI